MSTMAMSNRLCISDGMILDQMASTVNLMTCAGVPPSIRELHQPSRQLEQLACRDRNPIIRRFATYDGAGGCLWKSLAATGSFW